MLISKFDLYKTGWLDLVFESRNKAYGAYELRQHYAGNLVKAMGITFFCVAALCGASLALKKVAPTERIIPMEVLHAVPPPVVAPPKKVVPPEVKPIKAIQPPQPIQTTKFVEMVVKPDPEAQNPVKNDDIKGAVGQADVKGNTTTATSVIPIEVPPGDGGVAKPDETVHLGADVMPEPDGGLNAWSKFLNRNLRFPAQAEESGRVILSFVVEKDGHLSNIVVEKAAGHGFDEEAVRVLKLAKPWKPGLQAGQPIRVKYTIPINFQLTE